MAEELKPSQATQPTQVATQQYLDPRRTGQGNSGLGDDDRSDIYCILVPASPPSYLATAQIYEATPQHTISADNTMRAKYKVEGPRPENDELGSFDPASQGLVCCDIALRLSANLKGDTGGFYFGRNHRRCDIVIGKDDEVKRVSNVHFRIYINEYGIVMLQDQSTNGTIVDDVLLRENGKNNEPNQHQLQSGSIIIMAMTPPQKDFKFFVRLPQREMESETTFQRNLTNYFGRLNHARQEKQARAHLGLEQMKLVPGNPPDIFATPDPDTRPDAVTQESPIESSAIVRSRQGRFAEWTGGQKYSKREVIGKGAFAVVYMITTKYNGTPYAAKELEKRRFMKNGVLDQKVDQEMRIMQRIHHPNIVQFIEHIDWGDYLYIIMEYVRSGDLGSLIGEGGALHEGEVNEMARQLLSALDYLHQNNITHRDVKPDNILIQKTAPFQVKLTDFGLSKVVDTDETFLRTFCGTLLYCAPEVYTEYREYNQQGVRTMRHIDKRLLPQQRYDHAVDIWSLGGVLYYALCASPPYPAKNGISYLDLLHQIMTKALDIRPLQFRSVSESAIRFVKHMLHIRPEYRATIAELGQMSWFTGIDSQQELSYDEDEEDEVDMIRASSRYEPDELEQGASQLSLNQARYNGQKISDSQENLSDLTELQQPEIPPSFETSDGMLNGNESYGFMANSPSNANGRLFGEVDASAFGSSGAIPLHHLPLPARNGETIPNPVLVERDSILLDPVAESERLNLAGSWAVMPPPRLHSTEKAVENAASPDSGRASSLMGAESMVGHLNMESPTADSPATDNHVGNISNIEVGISLRRPREEDENFAAFPSMKRHKSTREIDLPVPPSVFWNPKDKSTHHTDYPIMSHSHYISYQKSAMRKGQTFAHGGGDMFESTMRSYRSPSVDREAIRAHSEPTKDEGLDMAEQHENGSDDIESVNRARTQKDIAVPPTARGSVEPSVFKIGGTNVFSTAQPVVGNDFQPPKRILAKVHGHRDSCLPTVSLNVTESLTSWGRGYKNTVRYSNGQDIRVPKYAFKIFLFKPNLYTENGLPTNIIPGNGKNSEHHDMAFYISTKATSGILINGVKLHSFDPQKPYTPSKNWGRLRHGDIINVWQHDTDKAQFTRFEFECYWGASREPRPPGDAKFNLLPEGDILNELERACLAQEKSMLMEIDRREGEDKDVKKAERKRVANLTKTGTQ